MSFSFGFFWESLADLAPYALVNLQLGAIAFVLAVTCGTLLTIVRSFKIAPVNMVIGVFISFVRGTPLIIQIFLCFYALPSAGIDMGPMTAGIVAIALNSAVFISEIQRGSLRALDVGQLEAATALGLSPLLIWAKVILPQLFRRIVPMLLNEATIVVKGTALLSIITVVELLRAAQQIGAADFRPFEPLVGAALYFLVINLVLATATERVERKIAAERR